MEQHRRWPERILGRRAFRAMSRLTPLQLDGLPLELTEADLIEDLTPGIPWTARRSTAP